MASQKHPVLLGAHMPLQKGLASGITSGHSIGCTCVQIFTKSNRQWRAKALTKDAIEAFKQARSDTKMGPIAAHASYLINLASPNEETVEKSIAALKDELERCDQLGIDFLVLHPGSHLKSSTLEEGLERIINGINTVFAEYKPQAKLLIETMAGQGTNIGHKFEQLGYIISKIKAKSHIGVCLDTCHIFAAGYEYNTPLRYKKVMDEFDKEIGLKYLMAIHLNESKTMCGSRKDRHEHIGKGKIGEKALELLINDPKLAHVPKYLETPLGDNDISDHEKNLKRLVDLLSSDNKKKAEGSTLSMHLD